MSIRSFKVFVRYELDGKETEFFFFKELNMVQTDYSTAGPLIQAAQGMLNRQFGWGADDITMFKVWWEEQK